MQITAEQDTQHVEKLHELEKVLMKNTSELISSAIDESYERQATDGREAYKIAVKTGFIWSIEGDGNLSENYKDYLDWGRKT